RTREIFLMAQLDGLSYVEIGRQLHVSGQTLSRKHAVRGVDRHFAWLATEE
ncbi:RNA polymerase subunit sigma, partial [Pseudomonas syringae pv. actinidifoliorum]|nr:RNA polymerase subunit sigma [Pseudomonas syringae pv. actinidifoliorum]